MFGVVDGDYRIMESMHRVAEPVEGVFVHLKVIALAVEGLVRDIVVMKMFIMMMVMEIVIAVMDVVSLDAVVVSEALGMNLLRVSLGGRGRRTSEVVPCSSKAITLNGSLRMEVPSSDFLEFLGFGKNLVSLFFEFFIVILGSRRSSEVIPSRRKTVTLDWLFWIEIPSSDFLEFLGFSKNFVFFFLIVTHVSRRPREEISSCCSGIHRHRLLWMHVPLCDLKQFGRISKDLLALVSIFLVFIFGSRGTSKEVAPTCGSKDCDLLLRVHVPISDLLKFVKVRKDLFAFLSITLVFLLRSRRTGEVVAPIQSRIHLHRLLGFEVPASNFLKLVRVCKNTLSFLFHLIGVVGFEIQG
ncbi:unnamed protein product [Pseudo-nitzschia multistriata]|uniref:Uncharacterized protein n=1 Tax=Pseudo-nitzschia multistriata TaxID=183589 RepID=A0A448ZSP0_9STRA|nr:unnamed protein product [Pseudo-nitzschia multistriata]